jgi:hypothetical protein
VELSQTGAAGRIGLRLVVHSAPTADQPPGDPRPLLIARFSAHLPGGQESLAKLLAKRHSSPEMGRVALDLTSFAVNVAIAVYFGTMGWVLLATLVGFGAAVSAALAAWHYRLAKR